jgi:Type IV secretion system pilin
MTRPSLPPPLPPPRPGWPVLAGSVPGLLPAAAARHVLAAATISGVISHATAWITGILAVIATFFLVLGGVRYLMAGGDPGQVEQAKTALKSAAIGYLLAMLAPVILTVLQSLVK